mmetsp:Transcript_31617/g.48354  ORF Transcript_31617/g.48354 Transcript_31617/m.48354 type:complete len:99 (-) Transcript_31617:29-325(-)
MLTLCEFMISGLVELSQLIDKGQATMGQISRSKSGNTRIARQVCALAREVCGGNGIILDYHVMKQHLDIEAVHSYEGTYEVNTLVSGRELTGGLPSFK